MSSIGGRPFPELFTDLIAQLSLLVRKEGQLARAEISDKVNRALTGLVLVVIGAVLLIPALVILLQAGMAALVQNGMSPALASLIVGGIALIIGIILALVGRSLMKPKALVPDRTIDQLQRDAAVARHAATPTSSAEEAGHGQYRDRAA